MKHEREPVEHTCPDIDKLQKRIIEVQRYSRGYESHDKDTNQILKII